MDLFRLLLVLGLGLLLWRFQFRGIRPVRDFFLWGIDYPFHFLLTALLILVIWGVAGAGMGLPGLFLNEDPLTQVLLGATVMLLFATIIAHYTVLGTNQKGWLTALEGLTSTLRELNWFSGSGRPPHALLENGFLENLTAEDIEKIHRAARVESGGGPASEAGGLGQTLSGQLESIPFRLLISPALFLIKGFGLVLLVGVVPALLIPLLSGDPKGCVERLPWLVGVCLGDLLGIILGCWTTRWAAEAANWGEAKQEILVAIRNWNPPAESPEQIREGDHAPPWLRLLIAFYAIHFIVNIFLPQSYTSRWIDWPEFNHIEVPDHHGGPLVNPDPLTNFPTLPLLVLVLELGLAIAALGLLRLAPRLLAIPFVRAMHEGTARLGKVSFASGLTLVMDKRVHRFGVIFAILLGFASLQAAFLMTADSQRSLLPGLRGYASLGSMLCCWLGAFWLATHAASGEGKRARGEKILATLGLVALVALHLFGTPVWVVGPLAIVGAASSGSRTLAGLLGADPKSKTRWAMAMVILLAGAFSLGTAWILGLPGPTGALWLGIAILLVGSTALVHATVFHPATLYPLTVILAYTAFAIPYNALDEKWQSAMPAAGSLACVIALLAAFYSLVSLARPRSALLTLTALAFTAVLINGAAMMVAPNQFKTTFPNLEAYYAQPIYLDSRDYFRDTTPSTVRLRNRQVTEDFDRLEKQGANERLATAFFTMNPQEQGPGGRHSVSLTVQDPQGRLRAMAGDKIRLAAEEWFTMQVEGADCVALAEEPFFRKIFPWFRYETLHLIRDGIIRGQTFPLTREGSVPGPRHEGIEPPTPYRILTGSGPGNAPVGKELVGLRLMGLAKRYQQAEAQYALIAINWVGQVRSVSHQSHFDTYVVEFEIPPGAEPLTTEQLGIMSSWMERCHLDALRPSQSVLAYSATPSQPLGTTQGECLVLDDARAEAPVPVAVFLASPSGKISHHPAFSPYWPTRQNLQEAMRHTPVPAPDATTPGEDMATRFTLRPAHDRGLFASRGSWEAKPWEAPAPGYRKGIRVSQVALYNAGRLRPGDRIMVFEKGFPATANSRQPSRSALFEVALLENRTGPDADFPPGAAWATLIAITDQTTLESTVASDKLPPMPDEVMVGQWQRVQPLNNTEVLSSWKSLVGPRWEKQKPKLVIVTVSGGGIRASVWTSVVLRKLEATLGSDFPYHIRLMTGASGGMVGGSYYTSSLAPPTQKALQGNKVPFADLHGATLDDFVRRMATDQLDAVTGQMLFADFPGTLNPFRKNNDRGRTLEKTWIRWTGGEGASPLAKPLQSYSVDESMGWRPSLVYTPMMVEDGRRLLISNLDLAFATRNVGGLLIEPSSRKIERPTIQGGDFDLSIHEEDDVFSLSAVEFFRLFPDAHDFRLTTAIRMSASFPWVSPAVNLPTLPPRRVVDAGYYDNYGVNLSALWISKMSDWLRENTSGVVVIQIRDNVSQGARTEIDFDRLGAAESTLDRLTWNGISKLVGPGLQALSTPLAGVTNSWQWTMAFRNDEQVDLLDLLFDGKPGRDFFRTVVFECPVDVSLNWKLTPREKEILSAGFGKAEADPRDELAKIKDYMTGKDSYEFHKWKIEHRNDRDFQIRLKEKYDKELRELGFTDTDRLTARESQTLYENVVKNLKRLELLSDWWGTGKAGSPAK